MYICVIYFTYASSTWCIILDVASLFFLSFAPSSASEPTRKIAIVFLISMYASL